eukprot:CAMPEP_0198202868 /NCGR_PEP_ID=MMETSP1445-20131203/6100_1 /TAXON_ID=36898 /ORGANISM="Pyramimonas sp., Strain CCMP2087" /LENGTH=96 /DNA_ID=CAMNT_0043873991 /DNA_START=172 /DNA_END=462 /DNA_ORIENTATION=+
MANLDDMVELLGLLHDTGDRVSAVKESGKIDLASVQSELDGVVEQLRELGALHCSDGDDRDDRLVGSALHDHRVEAHVPLEDGDKAVHQLVVHRGV